MNSESHKQASGLVSIVTPAFNAEAYLPETHQAVVSQTYPNWEWLIIDDGSTDGTAQVIADYAAADDRILALSVQSEHGLAARTRNVGLAAARGEFIALLDADDRWEPDKLAKQVDYLRTWPQAGGVGCWYRLFGDPERVSAEARSMLRGRVATREESLLGTPFQTSTVMFRRVCLEAVGGMDEDPRFRVGEDWEFFFRLISRFEMHRMPEFLAAYRVSGSSLIASARDSSRQAEWVFHQAVLDKGLLTPAEARTRTAAMHYQQARDNLLKLGGPFRRPLLRSILTGRPPRKAMLMLPLCILPAGVTRRVIWFLKARKRRENAQA